MRQALPHGNEKGLRTMDERYIKAARENGFDVVGEATDAARFITGNGAVTHEFVVHANDNPCKVINRECEDFDPEHVAIEKHEIGWLRAYLDEAEEIQSRLEDLDTAWNRVAEEIEREHEEQEAQANVKTIEVNNGRKIVITPTDYGVKVSHKDCNGEVEVNNGYNNDAIVMVLNMLDYMTNHDAKTCYVADGGELADFRIFQ